MASETWFAAFGMKWVKFFLLTVGVVLLTVVHKNITDIKKHVANYFLARLQLEIHK